MALTDAKRRFLSQYYGFGRLLPEEEGGPPEEPQEEPPPPGGMDLLSLQRLAYNAPWAVEAQEENPALEEAVRLAFEDGEEEKTEKTERERLLEMLPPEERLQALRVYWGLEPRARAGGAGGSPRVLSPRELGLVTPSDLLALLLAQRQREAEARQDLVETLLGLAPRLAAGQTWYGGFGPYGGATLLELLQGGPGAPRPLRVQPVPVETPEEIARRRAENEALIGAFAGLAP